MIAATNRNLAQDVKERRFRRDLFYRLNVVELEIPPLRERPEDLRGLAASILVRVARQMGRPITGYTPEAFEQILRYPWPGNIRELETLWNARASSQPENLWMSTICRTRFGITSRL